MVNNQKRGMLKDEDFGARITFGHPCPSGSCPMCDTHWHLLACVCQWIVRVSVFFFIKRDFACGHWTLKVTAGGGRPENDSSC